ncbi:Angiopoietin-1 receptor [Holothuria leucospilota]|uniref:Angiopoietin-1 receptor n=1 Tax=Holothuria leucospilota TaxID=206669 RepID=A0A9Q1C8Z9_HOLLE|nr:Angiopoietin-1 receptor [Holothuria leucospilota]
MVHVVAVATLFLFISCISAQDQVRMTMLSINHFRSESNGQYQCHLSDPDKTGTTVESFRAVDTRNGGDSNNPEPPDAVYQRRDNYPHHKVTLNDNGNDEGFGVFGCEATRSGKEATRISTTRMRSDADFVPANELFTQTVNIGDEDVSISMNSPTIRDTNGIRWRKDNSDFISSQSGSATYVIPGPIQLSDAGTYECQYYGERNLARQGLNLLLVRACPANRWDPPGCTGVCDSCYNGGICDENNGKCVCAPGFMGDNCRQASFHNYNNNNNNNSNHNNNNNHNYDDHDDHGKDDQGGSDDHDGDHGDDDHSHKLGLYSAS